MMQKMEKILPQTLYKLGLQRRFTAENIVYRWEEIVGRDIYQYARATRLVNGTLHVTVANSAWSHHLFMMKQGLMAKIHEICGEQWVQDIRFFTGTLAYADAADGQPGEVVLSPAEAAQVLQLDDADWSVINQQVEIVQDEAVRQRLKRVLYRHRSLVKAKKQLGWKLCSNCTNLCPPEEEYCVVCTREKKDATIRAIVKVLQEVPSVPYQELTQHVPCTAEEYQTARQRWIDALQRELYNGTIDDLQLTALIMLTTGKNACQIDPATFADLRKKGRKKAYVPAFRE